MRCIRCLGDERPAEVCVGTTRSGNGYGCYAVRLRAHRHGFAANVLDLAADERAHVDRHYDRRILRGRDFCGRGVGPRWQPLRVRTLAGSNRLQLLVADVVAMRVTEQDDVDGAETRIVCAGHGLASIVKYPDARRILEDRCTVIRTKL